MAKEVRWTDRALEDVAEICERIARDSETAAREFAARVFESVEHLGEFPQSGRVVPEKRRQELREVLVGDYRVIYRNRSKLVEIIHVHHAARRLDLGKEPR